MFFDNWAGLLKTAIAGVSAYLGLLVLLRISGKRTLSKMNSFDFVVTIALGSTLASTILSKSVAVLEGVVALGTLIFLQYFITWLSVRSKTVSGIIKAEPKLLYHKEDFLPVAMKMERVNKEEILQAMRRSGVGNIKDVDAVVMETDGSLSIIPASEDSEEITTLSDLDSMKHE